MNLIYNGFITLPKSTQFFVEKVRKPPTTGNKIKQTRRVLHILGFPLRTCFCSGLRESARSQDILIPEVSLILATKMNGEWLSKIQQVEGKNFRFCVYLSCYFKKQEPGFYIFWSGKFIQKVLWEENTCEEGICRTNFLKKEMRNSELLQLINDLHWGICFLHRAHNSHYTAY